MLAAVAHWLSRLPVYDRGSRFEPSNRQGFFYFFIFYNVQTALRIGIHGVYDKRLFDKKHCRQTIASVLFTLYIRICLLLPKPNTKT